MNFRKVIILTVGAFVVPLALLVFGATRSGSFTARLAEPALLVSNWLYMAAPHLLAVLFAAVARPARLYFLPWSLIALSLTLVAFQCWIWWWVPPRESGLAWVLYIPLSAIVLVLAAVAALWWQRSNHSFKRTPDGAV